MEIDDEKKLRLAMYAIPFGFGPVSKAMAITRAINKVMDVEWYFMGSGISLEYMKRENIDGHFFKMDNGKTEEENAAMISRIVDGAVVLMDNKWAHLLAPRVPTFFADSLSFMWGERDFKDYEGMNDLQAYYVQDIFGSYSHMQNLGIKNIVSVPPIIDTSAYKQDNEDGRHILHLGGLFNPFNRQTTQVYLKGMDQIIQEMNLKDPLILMSQTAIDAFPEYLSGFEVKSLPHDQSVNMIANSAFTWSSPGLTTMLEMANLQAATAPLPPQNYSQALNINNMVKHYGHDLHPVWHFLAEEYKEISSDIPEEEGVKMITDLNGQKLRDKVFISQYVTHATDASHKNTTLPKDLMFKESGADVIADDVRNFFESDQKEYILVHEVK